MSSSNEWSQLFNDLGVGKKKRAEIIAEIAKDSKAKAGERLMAIKFINDLESIGEMKPKGLLGGVKVEELPRTPDDTPLDPRKELPAVVIEKEN